MDNKDEEEGKPEVMIVKLTQVVNAKDRLVRLAPEVKELADILIRPSAEQEREWPSCAGAHKRLQSAIITYGYYGDHATKDGRAVAGRTRKVNVEDKVLIGHIDQAQTTFVVVVATDVWEAMDTTQRMAVLDHELSHIGFNAALEMTCVGHDLQEFRGVVERHGVDWDEGLRKFAETCQDKMSQVQLKLDLEPERKAA